MRQYWINSAQPASEQKRINDYFLSFLGEAPLPQIKIKPSRLEIACQDDDSTTLPLIRNVKNLRLYDPKIKSFLPADPNLLSVDQSHPTFKQYHLKPIYRYRNSLVFFCLDKASRVHLVNRHLLEYLNNHPDAPRQPDLSVVVAKNIGQFIALVDRGLIPLDYYSRVPLKRTMKRYICFQFDALTQAFIQTDRKLTKLPKNYLAIKVGPDVGFTTVKGKLQPYLNVSVYLE